MKEVARRMDQQTLGRESQGQKEQITRRAPENRAPERAYLSGPEQLPQGVLAGLPLLEMPPERLERLAALVGNQGMSELLERQSLPLEQTRFTLPREVGTAPYPVPETGVPLGAPPLTLPTGGQEGRAFDPGGLVY